MHTILNLKRALFVAIFLVLATFSGTSRVEAQVETPATQQQVADLQSAIVTLLTQLISQLQAQIAELVAQQSATQTQLGAVQAQVETVVDNTTSNVSLALPASVDVGNPVCKANVESVVVPINVTGYWTKGEVSFLSYVSRNNAPALNEAKVLNKRLITPSNSNVSLGSWNDSYEVSVSIDGGEPTLETVVVSNCY